MMNIFLLGSYTDIKKKVICIMEKRLNVCQMERDPDVVFKDNTASIHLLGKKKCV